MMKTMTKNKNRKQSLVAYEKIYRKIIIFEYKPGQYLEEKQLMDNLGIGRTPIREALLRLSTELLVQSQPQKGFIVQPITLRNTKSLFEALKIFESGIAVLAFREDATHCLSLMEKANKAFKKATERADVLGLVEANHEFHVNLARCSHNEYLVRGVREIRYMANRLSYLSYGRDTGSKVSLREHYSSVIRQHEGIMGAIMEKDETRLKEVILEHIRVFQQRIIDYMAS